MVDKNVVDVFIQCESLVDAKEVAKIFVNNVSYSQASYSQASYSEINDPELRLCFVFDFIAAKGSLHMMIGASACRSVYAHLVKTHIKPRYFFYCNAMTGCKESCALGDIVLVTHYHMDDHVYHIGRSLEQEIKDPGGSERWQRDSHDIPATNKWIAIDFMDFQATYATAAGQNVASQNVASQNVAGQNVAGQNVASQNVASQNVASQNVASQNVANQDIANQAAKRQKVPLVEVKTDDESEGHCERHCEWIELYANYRPDVGKQKLLPAFKSAHALDLIDLQNNITSLGKTYLEKEGRDWGRIFGQPHPKHKKKPSLLIEKVGWGPPAKDASPLIEFYHSDLNMFMPFEATYNMLAVLWVSNFKDEWIENDDEIHKVGRMNATLWIMQFVSEHACSK
jgi:hypothetical protein